MSDTVFREPVETPVEPIGVGKDAPSISITKVEVPYLDYKAEHGKPFVAEHYDLGSFWNDRTNGFSTEVTDIEDYLRYQIDNGELANSIKGVKDRLKEIEKITNMDKENRKTVKMRVMAEYIRFLKKTSNIKRNLNTYGSN